MQLFFPYEHIRPVQDKLLKCVQSTLENKKNLIVHAPTGLGKTAATLAPALSFAIAKDLTVFFLTSRHTQHKIVLDTLNEIKQKHNLSVIATSIIGKKWMCLFPGTHSMRTHDFTEFCKAMRDDGKCQYYLNARSKQNSKALLLLEDLEKKSPLETEKVIGLSSKSAVCPYEMSLMLAEKSKIIISDYYYLFNPSIRESFLAKTGKTLEKAILIIDEGHNLPSRLRELLTVKLSNRIVRRAIKEAQKYKYDELTLPLIELEALMIKLSENMSADEKLLSKDAFISGIENIKKYDDLIAELKIAADHIREEQKTSSLGSIADFLEQWPHEDIGFVRIMSKQDDLIMINYRCLDPSVASKEVLDTAYATIIMSGTLNPTSMYHDVLGFDKNTEEVEFPNPFPEQNKLTLVVPRTSTKFTLRSEEQFKRIADHCSDIMKNVPGCCAIFFPSYQLRDAVNKYLTTTKPVFLEHPKLSKEEKQELIDKFKSYKDKGAVLLAVAAGSFGEGIDLPGVIKCIIVVGLPLDKPDLETKQLIEYYDKKFAKGWEYGYILPALTKCMQNAGRCIRSEKDKGVIVFLDERYTWPQYFKCFPQDWNIKITVDYGKEIQSFFEHKV